MWKWINVKKKKRYMEFSLKGLVLIEEPPVLNLKSYDVQNGDYDVIRTTLKF